MKNKKNILIIGGGVFGVAISQVLLNNEQNVYITTTDAKNKESIMNGKHDSFNNLELLIPNNCYTNYIDAFKNKIDIIIFCVPSDAINSVFEQIKHLISSDMIIINAAKGLNPINNSIWSDLFIYNGNKLEYALLVGPSFASEIVKKEKTIVNIVSNNKKIANDIIQLFNNEYFKLIYFDNEYIASLVSSFKNSLALGSGLLSSQTKSLNTKSSYLFIGIKEICNILKNTTHINGFELFNFFGLADIFLTCSSNESRNYKFGYSIGKNGINNTIKEFNNRTVEGYKTLKDIYSIIKKNNINSPMFLYLYKICYENEDETKFINYVWNNFNY